MAAKPVEYDRVIIQEFAQRLYRQAASIILTSTLLGLFLGGIVGAAGAGLAGIRGDIGSVALLGAAFGAIAGFMRGRERAFKLKLEAQMALCQARIERNTSGTNS